MKHELPDLPYDYAALEPHIDARTPGRTGAMTTSPAGGRW